MAQVQIPAPFKVLRTSRSPARSGPSMAGSAAGGTSPLQLPAAAFALGGGDAAAGPMIFRGMTTSQAVQLVTKGTPKSKSYVPQIAVGSPTSGGTSGSKASFLMSPTTAGSTSRNLAAASQLRAVSLEYSYADLAAATQNWSSSRKLGSGKHGTLYMGELKDGSEVAVKAIDLAAVVGAGDAPEDAGFDEEVIMLSKFRHPNLVTLLGWGSHDSFRYLVYELLAGGDLFRRMHKSRHKTDPRPFPWYERLSVLLDAASGLSHMHNSTPKAFHRDIKSANILLDRYGTAKMADFGLSCSSSHAGADHVDVRSASGTPGYRCPLYERTGRVSENSEAYSFAMVMLEVLLGLDPSAADAKVSGGLIFPIADAVSIGKPGDEDRCLQTLDVTADWPLAVAQEITQLALRGVSSQDERKRPSFVEIVKALRVLVEKFPAQDRKESFSRHAPTAVSEQLLRQHKQQQQQEQLREQELQQQELQKEEQVKQQQVKQEQLKQEQLQQQQLKQEQLKQAQLQKEQLKQEQQQQQQQQLKQEELQKEQLKQEQLKQQHLQKEQLKQEQLKQEQLKQEQLKQQDLQKEQLKQEQLKQEQLKQEQLKQQDLQKEQLKQEQDLFMQEQFKQQQQQQQLQKDKQKQQVLQHLQQQLQDHERQTEESQAQLRDQQQKPQQQQQQQQQSQEQPRDHQMRQQQSKAPPLETLPQEATYFLELTLATGSGIGELSADQRQLLLKPCKVEESSGALVSSVGRGQQPDLFEAWLPDTKIRTCVSRTAFEVSWHRGAPAEPSGAWLTALGSGPVSLDGNVLAVKVPVALRAGEEIGLLYGKQLLVRFRFQELALAKAHVVGVGNAAALFRSFASSSSQAPGRSPQGSFRPSAAPATGALGSPVSARGTVTPRSKDPFGLSFRPQVIPETNPSTPLSLTRSLSAAAPPSSPSRISSIAAAPPQRWRLAC
ncbi:unnamed protein product, partial [Polarella glacialis]